ncbi:MAG: hypothetical protein KC431_25000 [Myxococcales bacterium]|nr:hypothetical protein [Myxococcales bacterium]
MANVVVKESHLTYGGVGYFRGHAEEVELGSIGEKRTPLTSMNYLEVKDRIPAGKISRVKSVLVDIDFASSTKSAFGIKLAVPINGVPVSLGASTAYSKLQSGELRMVKFSVDNNVMKNAANASSARLKDLAKWGNDARIAHQLFVVMSGEIATAFSNNTNVELGVGASGLEATANVATGGTRQTTVQIAAGTCFAYLLLKIDWNKGKTQIDDLNDDKWSLS